MSLIIVRFEEDFKVDVPFFSLNGIMEKENKILIFRTSITRKCDIKRIEKLLAQYPQIDKWNVAFEDWEKILRIECSGITAVEISAVLRNNHIFTSELE